PGPYDHTATRRRTTTREDACTILVSLWLIVGLFLDGHAHEDVLTGDESFVTPWHAVFYAGFGATVAWLVVLARRGRTGGQSLIDALPHGYELAWSGMILFGLGGAGDAAWHTAFGVETGIDALMSPTHLVLFAGLLLMLLSPWRAARHDTVPDRRIGGAAAWSVGLATALAGFFANYVWGLGIGELVVVPYDPVSQTGEAEVIAGVGSVLVTTVILLGVAAALLRRGHPPRLWFTTMFLLVAGLVSLGFDEGAAGVVAAGAAGVVLDVLTAPGLRARLGVTAALAGAAVAMWTVFFGLVGLDTGIAWPREIWAGSIVLAALTAVAVGRFSEPDVR
ncbi:MAG TPA: hypothetical protein VI916_11350, partial [Acidimicrobiia bacterium]|nr:hypothetical protein [Acidimicrobiia bacterium]